MPLLASDPLLCMHGGHTCLCCVRACLRVRIGSPTSAAPGAPVAAGQPVWQRRIRHARSPLRQLFVRVLSSLLTCHTSPAAGLLVSAAALLAEPLPTARVTFPTGKSSSTTSDRYLRPKRTDVTLWDTYGDKSLLECLLEHHTQAVRNYPRR